MQCSLLSAILTLAFGIPVLRAQTSSLPELPQVDLTEFSPVVKEQVQEAYETACANPRNADASGKLGMLLDLYKRRESAAVWYKRAHQLDPSSFRWLYYLGWLQSALGKRAEATATLRTALRLNPDYLPARLKLADNVLGAGDGEEATKVYESILKDHPDAAEAYYGIGRIRSGNGDLPAAVEAYRKAVELFPLYGAAHYGLAQAYRKLGDGTKTEEHLKLHAANRTLVPPVPDPLRDEMRTLDRGAASLVQRGLAFQDAGRIEDAIAEHEKALELDPEFVLAHANLIILYGKTNQPQKAEEHFRAAVRLNPNNAESYYNYGVLLFKKRDYPAAEEMFRKAVEINPFNSQALHNLGVMREQQGRLDEALEFYRKAIDRQPNYPLAHFNIGKILANQGKYDQAISQFQMALSPDNENTPAYLYALSATYARAGNREEALKYGRQARERAAARGQTELLRSIDRDLQILESTKGVGPR
ncbi:MAG TPA: tetratricopeptide repeat protein [Acidobacteriota bacterium]|nr:tetratricopeptide repeat protein [Acidobacteriota bacterium]